jgi:hypothetical protein
VFAKNGVVQELNLFYKVFENMALVHLVTEPV